MQMVQANTEAWRQETQTLNANRGFGDRPVDVLSLNKFVDLVHKFELKASRCPTIDRVS